MKKYVCIRKCQYPAVGRIYEVGDVLVSSEEKIPRHFILESEYLKQKDKKGIEDIVKKTEQEEKSKKAKEQRDAEMKAKAELDKKLKNK